MNTAEQEKEKIVDNESLSRLSKIFCGYFASAIEHEFPNLEFREGGAEKFCACISFILGVKIGGNHSLANHLAKNFCSNFDRWNKGTKKIGRNAHNEMVLFVGDDGCANSFTFCLYKLAEDQSSSIENDNCIMLSGSSRFEKAKYHKLFHGGIIFHGLNQPTYSVRLEDSGIGWSMHT